MHREFYQLEASGPSFLFWHRRERHRSCPDGTLAIGERGAVESETTQVLREKLSSSLRRLWPELCPSRFLLAGVYRRRWRNSRVGSRLFHAVRFGRQWMVRYQELRAEHEAHKRNIDPPRTRIHHGPGAMRRRLLHPATGTKPARQERNQASGDCTGVRERRSPVRQGADQRCQFPGRGVPRQLSQLGGLLPRVHVRPRQPGEHAHQHAVFVLADGCEQKVIEF